MASGVIRTAEVFGSGPSGPRFCELRLAPNRESSVNVRFAGGSLFELKSAASGEIRTAEAFGSGPSGPRFCELRSSTNRESSVNVRFAGGSLFELKSAGSGEIRTAGALGSGAVKRLVAPCTRRLDDKSRALVFFIVESDGTLLNRLTSGGGGEEANGELDRVDWSGDPNSAGGGVTGARARDGSLGNVGAEI